MRHVRSARRFGILLHGSKIWLSEFLSLIIVITLAFSLFLLTWKIITNETTINRHTRQLSILQADRIMLAHTERELNNRVAIAELLCSIASHRIAPDVLLELSEIVYSNSRKFGYDPLLLLAVIEVESVFNPKARGQYRSGKHSGALGLMQLKLATAREVARQLDMDTVSPGDLLKPEINVILGVSYLTTMIERFKNFKLGLLAYNQGPGFIRKQLSDKSALSAGYYRKVLASYYRLQEHSLEFAKNASRDPVCR